MKKSNYKSPQIYFYTIVIWCILFLYTIGKLSYFLNNVNLLEIIIIIVFLFFLNLFWFYGIYFIIIFIFSLIYDDHYIPISNLEYTYKVAILYTTMNDFCEESVLSCITQTYSSFHVYILDDSTENIIKEKIDKFIIKYNQKVTLIRRKKKIGFKAGNLNYALKNFAIDYDYFAIIDSDELIPNNFIQNLIEYFAYKDDIAFVQANHLPIKKLKTNFSKLMSLSIIPLWSIFMKLKNKYGFVCSLGHGVLFRRDIWEKIGGFPEVISEDLAFSVQIGLLGYKGIYAKNVICYENFPNTYYSFRKQQEKYILGFCEFLHKFLKKTLTSKKLCFIEKIDLVIFNFTLLIPTIFLIYIFLYLIMSIILINRNYIYVINSLQYIIFFDWDFLFINIIIILSPYLLLIKNINKKYFLSYIFKAFVPFSSRMFIGLYSIISYLFFRKTFFYVTGDLIDNQLTFKISNKETILIILEFLLGIILVIFAITILDLVIFSYAIALIISLSAIIYGWDNWIINKLLIIPFLLFVIAIILISFRFF